MTQLLALGLGLIYSLGFAPFYFWPATCVAIGGLFWLLQHSPRPLLSGWLFGVGKYALGASWVFVSIHVYGNAPVPLAALLVALFVLGMGLFCVPVAWLSRRLLHNRNATSSTGLDVAPVLSFSVAWVLMDWVLTWFLTGFPWLFPGFALLDTWAASLAPVTGVLGLGLLLVLSITAGTAMLAGRRGSVGLGLLLLGPWVLALMLTPIEWVEPGPRKSVALVQNNLDQKRKWRPEERQINIDKNLSLSAPHWDVDLMLWPEAAITAYPAQAAALLQQLDEQARSTRTSLVVGMPGTRTDAEGNYRLQNLALGLGMANGRFAKHHLVPFGDYVPMQQQLRGLIEFFDLPMSHASPGGVGQRNIDLGFTSAATAICYEVAYGESMRRYASSAGVLLTISNDTWFGDSIGPHQHLQIARMRAAENGRWLLRATQNGITAVVDHKGREAARLPQFVGQALRSEFQIMQGRTPYNYVGDWPLLAVMLIIALSLLYLPWAKYSSVTK